MDRLHPLWARIRARIRQAGPIHLLLVLAIAELAIYRLAVPALQVVVKPGEAIPPTPAWHAVVAWLGLFLHYFVGTLAVGILAVRAVRAARGDGGSRTRELACAAAMAGMAVIAAISLLVGEDAIAGFVLETALVAACLVAFNASIRRANDLGAMIGLGLLIAPIVIHYYGVVGAWVLWYEGDAAAYAARVQWIGINALCLAAIASPYCFGPRPFHRAVIRFPPIIAAMVVAGGSAVVARTFYSAVQPIVADATGIVLSTERVDPGLALYILAFATLCWTLTSCAIADTTPRRRVGVGIALVALGGYFEVAWPAYYALVTAGVFTIVDAVPALRPAERSSRIAIVTPPIDDRIWQGWVTGLVGGLRAAGHHVNALTTRGEDDTMSTVVSGDIAARAFRMRIERVAGSVISIDARFGRDVGDARAATFTVLARPEGRRDLHPDPPPAAPRVELAEDLGFASRFKIRGDRAVVTATLDDWIRARLTATMDGWLAVWKDESLRHRVYPGRGAPIDHPIPLSDLATRGAGPDAVDRMIATIAVLADIAVRALPETAPPAAAPPDADDLEDAS